MVGRMGSEFQIRLSPEKRKEWEKAARRVAPDLPLATFVKVACDLMAHRLTFPSSRMDEELGYLRQAIPDRYKEGPL